MRSSVIISICPRLGFAYEITVVTQAGKTLSGLTGGPGDDPGEVAGRAAMYAADHCLQNPSGGDIVGPEFILKLIPKHLINIPPYSMRDKNIYGK